MLNPISILILVVSVSTLAQAGKVEEQIYKVTWKEQGNRIVHNSVCYSYEDGSIPYRRCRIQAKRYFTERCRFFSDKYGKTKAPYNQTFRKKRDKFCYSMDAFFPI